MGLPKQERLGGGVTNKLQNPAHAPTPSRRIPLRPSTGEIRTPRSGGHGGIADGGSGPATGRSHARGNEVIQAASQPRGMAHPSHEDYGGVMGSNTPRVGSRPRSEFPKQREGEGADLFGREVRKVERLRPRTAPSRSSSRAEEAPVQGEGDEGNAAERPQTSASRVSQTSSIVEEKLVNFQMSFQRKNAAKFHNMQDAFRRSDVNKAGVLGRDEIATAMRSVDIPVDQAVIDRLLAKCNTKGMSFEDFRDQLWIDDRMTVVIDERKNARAGSRGDNSGSKYLWSPLKGPQSQRYVGAFNDTLEADRIAAGLIPPRLDSNFSSVQYDILTLDQQPQSIDPLVHVPVKNRPYLYDPPAPAGRRVAYDRGEYPYDVVSLRSRAVDSVGPEGRSILFQVPVRVVTFARLHRGDYPTQQAHMLTNTAV